jgi:hypothetical protein
VKKVICIIFIYTILHLASTDLSADQKFLEKGNGSGNGYGYGHGYDIGDGPGNGYGYGHGYDIGDGPGNGYGFGHRDKPPGTNAPEPISSALFALGGVGLGLYKKFKNKD